MIKKVALSALLVVLIPAFISTYYLTGIIEEEILDNHIIKVKQVSKNEIVELDLEEYENNVQDREIHIDEC